MSGFFLALQGRAANGVRGAGPTCHLAFPSTSRAVISSSVSRPPWIPRSEKKREREKSRPPLSPVLQVDAAEGLTFILLMFEALRILKNKTCRCLLFVIYHVWQIEMSRDVT